MQAMHTCGTYNQQVRIHITSAMLSIFWRVGAILLAVVYVSHALYALSCLKTAQKLNTTDEAFMCKLTHIAGRCRSADVDNAEGRKGNDCRLKKWYRKLQRTSDERRTVRCIVEELATFELALSRLYICP